MKIKDLKIYHIQAGWRPWSFLKITTSSGLVGWSECTDSHDTRNGIEGVIKDLKNIIIGEDPRNISKMAAAYRRCTNQYERTHHRGPI